MALKDYNFLEKLAVLAETENGKVIDEEIAGEVNAAKPGQGQRQSLYAEIGNCGVVAVFGEAEVEMFEERETISDQKEIGVSEKTHVGAGEGFQSWDLSGERAQPI